MCDIFSDTRYANDIFPFLDEQFSSSALISTTDTPYSMHSLTLHKNIDKVAGITTFISHGVSQIKY